MNYAEFLSESINKSGLSLGDICAQLAEKGIQIDKSYISKLRTGNRPPANEEISRALAEVTGADPEKLIMLGYIDKAPKEVQPFIRWYVDRFDSLATWTASFFIDEDLEEGEWKTQLQSFLNKLNQLSVEDKLDFVINRFNRVRIAQPDYFRDLGRENDIDEQRIEQFLQASNGQICRIPVYVNGQDEESYEWVSTSKIRFGEYIYFIAPDDSMSNAGIPKNAKVLCKIIEEDENEVESGKIYLIQESHNKHQFSLRRVFLQDSSIITLQPANPKFAPKVMTNRTDFIPIATVASVEFDPNAEQAAGGESSDN